MRQFKNIFQYHLNVGKHTSETIAKQSGLAKQRLRKFLEGQAAPDIDELTALAEALSISVSDLMSEESNSINGVVFLSAGDSLATSRDIYRENGGRRIRYYTYRDTAFAKSTPHARGVILDLHCTQEEDVVQNNGHFQDALTVVLQGNIKGYWIDADGHSKELILRSGHSYYARGFVPHTYRSFVDQTAGRILSFTFSQHVSTEVQKELSQLGMSRACDNIRSPNPHGNLIACHLNNSMMSSHDLSVVTGIELPRITAFLESGVTPTFYELDAIAAALCISTGELLPAVQDSDAGLMHMTLAESSQTTRKLRGRNGEVKYEVRDLARTKEASSFRAHHISILAHHTAPDDCDLFSTEHTLLFALAGRFRLLWIHDEQPHELELTPYDSIYIEPFVRFTMSSKSRAELIRFQYPSLTAGDPRKELMNKGVSTIRRLLAEQRAWADKQSSG